MRNFEKRLQKLERHFTDESGLVPHSPQWLSYWQEWMLRGLRGEDLPGQLSIEAYRAVIAHTPAGADCACADIDED
jgi:hypothetical protein